MKEHEIKAKWNYSTEENSNRSDFFKLFKKCPVPDNELLLNLPLFIKRQDLSAIFFMNEMYQKIINVHGVVMEFGVRWGKNLSLFESFRGMYEPFNHNRKIVGFDTFEGFPSVDEKDGGAEIISVGSFNVTENYYEYLTRVLDYHEKESPISHLKKYQLVKGDASIEIMKYLNENPETIIALAYFDFDIYKPTKDCLLAVKSHLTKGSVVGFDELNYHDFPGETLAFKEVFGLDKYKINHSLYSPVQSYIIID